MFKIVIWGATGQAIVLEELLSSTSAKIEVFFENDTNVNSPIEGVPIYYKEAGFNKWLSTIENSSEFYYLVAIGGNNGNIRSKIGERLKEAGLRPFTAIHPTAFVAKNAILGEGVQILANSNVCARVKVGKYSIIDRKSVV